MNITVFAVGLTRYPDLNHLRELVSPPVDERLLPGFLTTSEWAIRVADLLVWKICHNCYDPVGCTRKDQLRVVKHCLNRIPTYPFVTIACKNPENFQWMEMVSTNATNDTSVMFDDDVMAIDESDLQSGTFIISTIYGIDSVKRCQNLCIKSLACT